MEEGNATVWVQKSAKVFNGEYIIKVAEDCDKFEGTGDCWHVKSDATAIYTVDSDTRYGTIARTILPDIHGDIHNINCRSLFYQFVHGVTNSLYRIPKCGDWECLNPAHQDPKSKFHLDITSNASEAIIAAPEGKKFYDWKVKPSRDGKHLLIKYELLDA